jgi:hypothetical protein
MGAFLRTNITEEGFIRGAARIVVAPMSVAFPAGLGSIITLASGAAQYDLASGYTELGATKTGINILRNNAEETFDVDQIYGDIGSEPTSWEMSVGTALAEVTLERIQFAWEAGAIMTDTTPAVNERHIGLGQPPSYTQRRLAVLFKRPNGKIRAYVFRKTQRQPQESSFTHQKTGEQATIPVRFRCLADDTVSDPYAQFGEIIDQV